MHDPTDNLTPVARRILKLNAERAYEKLTITLTDGNPAALADLSSLGSGRELCARPATRPDEADCLLAGLWLWQDYLDEAHEICQKIETASGSWWHAILHRREGDFSNAKYWYARAGSGGGHPAAAAVAAQAGLVLRDDPADKLLLRVVTPTFSGAALTDLVQAVHRNPADPRYRAAVALQQLEFRTLFEWNAATAQA